MRKMVVRSWEKRELGHHCSMDIELQFYNIKSVIAMDNGDSCTIL